MHDEAKIIHLMSRSMNPLITVRESLSHFLSLSHSLTLYRADGDDSDANVKLEFLCESVDIFDV